MTSRGGLAFTADIGADRLNTDARQRMGGISRENGKMEQGKNPRVQKMWEIAGIGRRQKDNGE